MRRWLEAEPEASWGRATLRAVGRLLTPSILGSALLTGGCATEPPPPTARYHLSYATGGKKKPSTWSPADREKVLIGADLDWRPAETWPVWLVAMLAVGTAERAPDFAQDPLADSAGTSELGVGVRWYGTMGRVESFVSAGLAHLQGEVVAYDAGDAWELDHDGALGWWIDAGARFLVRSPVQLGLLVRYLTADDLDLLGTDVDGGGVSVLATVGIRR